MNVETETTTDRREKFKQVVDGGRVKRDERLEQVKADGSGGTCW